MTTAENERLAVVENEVKHVKEGLTDVKTVVANFDGKLDGVLLYIKGEQSARTERRREGAALRWALSVIIPTVISIAGIIVDRMTAPPLH